MASASCSSVYRELFMERSSSFIGLDHLTKLAFPLDQITGSKSDHPAHELIVRTDFFNKPYLEPLTAPLRTLNAPSTRWSGYGLGRLLGSTSQRRPKTRVRQRITPW